MGLRFWHIIFPSTTAPADTTASTAIVPASTALVPVDPAVMGRELALVTARAQIAPDEPAIRTAGDEGGALAQLDAAHAVAEGGQGEAIEQRLRADVPDA